MLRQTNATDKATGWAEIGVYSGTELLAVITRPMRGAKWFLHRAGRYHHERERFATRKAAIAAAYAPAA